MRYLFGMLAFLTLLGSLSPAAIAQVPSKRLLIAQCAHAGAINVSMMQSCSGLSVPPPVFSSCLNGGECFDEPPVSAPLPPPGVPFCGGPSLGALECPQPIPCGYVNTVSCQLAIACGTGSYPHCLAPIPCGVAGALPCPSNGSIPALPPPFIPDVAYNQINPRFNAVMSPAAFQPLSPDGVMPVQPSPRVPPVVMVAPSLPDLERLRRCRENASSEDEFNSCLVTSAMSGPGRISADCLKKYSDNLIRAVGCSSGSEVLESRIDLADAAAQCAEDNLNDRESFKTCVAEHVLGSHGGKYVDCAIDEADASDVANCALAHSLVETHPELIKCATMDNSSIEVISGCMGRLAGGSNTNALVNCGQASTNMLEALDCVADSRIGDDERALIQCAIGSDDFDTLRACAGTGVPTVNEARFVSCVDKSSGDLDGLAQCLGSTLLTRNEQAYVACSQEGDASSIAECVGTTLLGSKEKRYLECAAQDSGSETDIAACIGTQEMGERERAIATCGIRGGSSEEILACIGGQYLGANEQRYLKCAVQNHFDAAGTVICSLSTQMNPELQIAVSCAAASGGEPMTFASCTAGRLGERELEKCWAHGIATDDGCYGKGNTIRQFYDGMDDRMRTAFGSGNELYKAYHFLNENIYSPGPNNEFVKAMNNVMNDLQNGPSQSNDIVRAFNDAGDFTNSVGQAIGVHL